MLSISRGQALFAQRPNALRAWGRFNCGISPSSGLPSLSHSTTISSSNNLVSQLLRGYGTEKIRSSKVRKRAQANRNRRAMVQAENIRKKMMLKEDRKQQFQLMLLEKEKIKEINRRARERVRKQHEEESAAHNAETSPRPGEALEAEVV